MKRFVVIIPILACGLVLSGCSGSGPVAQPSAAQTEQVAPGDIPDTQAFVSVVSPTKRWRLQVPEGWAQRIGSAGFTFTDKFNSVTALETTSTVTPTTTSVRQSEAAKLESATPGFTLRGIESFTRAGAAGVLVRYEFDSSKDAVTERVHRQAGELYVMVHSGHEVLLTLAGAVGADNVDPWRTVTDSFRWS